MLEIGVFEAKNKLSALLDKVEAGVTEGGLEVAGVFDGVPQDSDSAAVKGAAEAAHEQRLALPGLALMTSMFNAASALGHDRDGTQAVADALDSVAVLK